MASKSICLQWMRSRTTLVCFHCATICILTHTFVHSFAIAHTHTHTNRYVRIITHAYTMNGFGSISLRNTNNHTPLNLNENNFANGVVVVVIVVIVAICLVPTCKLKADTWAKEASTSKVNAWKRVLLASVVVVVVLVTVFPPTSGLQWQFPKIFTYLNSDICLF